MNTIESTLGSIVYPGVGLIVGRLNGLALAAYFITTKDEKHGIMLSEESDTLSVFCRDQENESIQASYTALRVCDGTIVLSSGDQTDTICNSLTAGQSFQYALSTRGYEPDGPVYTPRIAGAILPTGRCTIGIAKKADGAPDCRRKYWSYDPREGEGFLIHTYDRDGATPHAFEGAPVVLELGGTPEALADQIWSALAEKTRVAVYVRSTDLFTGRFTSAMRSVAADH